MARNDRTAMNTHEPKSKRTLAEAGMQALGDTTDLSALEFPTTAEERKATSSLWVHLTGSATDTGLEAISGGGAQTDGEFFLMLNEPAREFVNWFRREDWEHFALTDATGGDAWACTALERARAMCAAMGPLALQAPLRLCGAV
jgi:hypothetical protein